MLKALKGKGVGLVALLVVLVIVLSPIVALAVPFLFLYAIYDRTLKFIEFRKGRYMPPAPVAAPESDFGNVRKWLENARNKATSENS